MKKQLNSKEIEGIDLIPNDKYRNTSTIIRKWYVVHKRDLPWREINDAYQIWISEIILQQTRVVQGYDYYVRFINRFPDIRTLADANEEEVLIMWQGLGYYSRARNLHHAAQTIVELHNGVFPSNYKNILSLKGIGEYTAAAIASFAFGLPYAVVDGNVYRVLSRIFNIDVPIDSTQGKKLFAALAQELLSKQEPAEHNQAMMEFGALQCTPVSPDCASCPLSDICLAYLDNRVSMLPIKSNKTKVRNRYFNYLDIRYGDTLYINKRDERDIWQHLYELPLIETDKEIDLGELIKKMSDSKMITIEEIDEIQHICTLKHVLSHQHIYASFYKIIINSPLTNKFVNIAFDKLQEYPISRLVEKYFEKDANSN